MIFFMTILSTATPAALAGAVEMFEATSIPSTTRPNTVNVESKFACAEPAFNTMKNCAPDVPGFTSVDPWAHGCQHRRNSAGNVFVLVHLIRKPGVESARSISCAFPWILGKRIAALNQTVLDQTVKGRAVVDALLRVLDEGLDVLRGVFGKQLDHYLPHRRVQYCFELLVIAGGCGPPRRFDRVHTRSNMC
jgi:hypothetical protein